MGRLRTIANAQNLCKNFKTNILHHDIDEIFRRPVFIEIGCGKGEFIFNNALINTNNNYIGIEKFSTVALIAMKKIDKLDPNIDNVFICNVDASNLHELLKGHKVDKIFLNFSDPWPKKRHIKKRLVHSDFINLYKTFLKNDSSIEFKTDNIDLFNYCISVLDERADIIIIDKTFDLYGDIGKGKYQNNIQTEYEKKFYQIKKINKIEFKFK